MNGVGFAEYMGGEHGRQEYEKKQQKWRLGETLLCIAQVISDDRAWKMWAAYLPCLKLQVVLSAPNRRQAASKCAQV